MRHPARTFRDLRGCVLDAIAEPPPLWPGECYFQRDLDYMARDELVAERDNISLRLRLTPTVERNRWPGPWFEERLQRIEVLLRPVKTWPRGART